MIRKKEKLFQQIIGIFVSIMLPLCTEAGDTVYETIDIPLAMIASSDPITNPGFGLVLPNYRSGSNDQPDLKTRFPYVEIAYKRFLWSELEPEEGRYDFNTLDRWIAQWKARGYRVGLGVMSTTVGRQGTPLWVFKAGVPGVNHMGGRQKDPVMWNDLYLQKLHNFVGALGAMLKGGKDIEFVDIRGIGVWGEMHFGFGIRGMWTQDELYEHGLSEESLTAAYFRQMESYKQAFPNTRLFLNISGSQERILKQRPQMVKYFLPRKNAEYRRMGTRVIHDKPFILPISEEIHKKAVALGIGLRSDGLSEEELVFGSSASYFRDYCWPGGPVQCFFEFAGENLRPDEVKRLLDHAVNSYASYININFQAFKDMNMEMENILRDTAKRIGYQYHLERVSLRYPTVVSKDSSADLQIDHRWINKGNTTARESCVLRFSLLDDLGKVIAEQNLVPEPPVPAWVPGLSVAFKSNIQVPPYLNEGTYILAIQMIDSKGHPVGLNLKPLRPGERLYPLTRFRAVLEAGGNISLRMSP